ncbi:hypothetical protein LLEC1_03498 [Akanthomyces lecanii]|uniref:Asl1-like glycosyl hydrolase catalytic domain-containing protein n=1 Tax=Cordyceps confragosa TaxID=2714763 RepID=A0A179IHN3_CORDF|nr:hypothetical protein LLEC1_03498 [Akanthomyces lecanii]
MAAFKLLAVAAITSMVHATNHPAGKRGLGSNDGLDLSGFESAGPIKMGWQYNWDSNIGGNKLSTVEYVPMLHSLHDDHEKVWADRASKWLEQGTGHLLGFNEPEQPLPQAAMSVADALGAPSVSNDGWDWITQFMDQCQGCHVDFIPIHWYNPFSLGHDFENWVRRVCGLGKPVWITEVSILFSAGIVCEKKHVATDRYLQQFKGMGGSSQDELAFLQQAMAFLEGNACVQRYAYFGTANNDMSLLSNEQSRLSELGHHYALD